MGDEKTEPQEQGLPALGATLTAVAVLTTELLEPDITLSAEPLKGIALSTLSTKLFEDDI